MLEISSGESLVEKEFPDEGVAELLSKNIDLGKEKWCDVRMVKLDKDLLQKATQGSVDVGGLPVQDHEVMLQQTKHPDILRYTN